jgi:putative ABC transport system substrate-binding protein
MRFNHLRRREFISFLGGAATVWPLRLSAQPGERMRRIGVLMGALQSDREGLAFVAAFREGLQKLGWAEDRNVQIDYRWAAPDDAESIKRFARELVALQAWCSIRTFRGCVRRADFRDQDSRLRGALPC